MEKVVPVSTTTSPVTQTAEVAVKSASKYDKLRWLIVATGSDKSIEPKNIIIAKLSTSTFAGLYLKLLFFGYDSIPNPRLFTA
jgi:hypothetical protein